MATPCLAWSRATLDRVRADTQRHVLGSSSNRHPVCQRLRVCVVKLLVQRVVRPGNGAMAFKNRKCVYLWSPILHGERVQQNPRSSSLGVLAPSSKDKDRSGLVRQRKTLHAHACEYMCKLGRFTASHARRPRGPPRDDTHDALPCTTLPAAHAIHHLALQGLAMFRQVSTAVYDTARKSSCLYLHVCKRLGNMDMCIARNRAPVECV